MSHFCSHWSQNSFLVFTVIPSLCYFNVYCFFLSIQGYYFYLFVTDLQLNFTVVREYALKFSILEVCWGLLYDLGFGQFWKMFHVPLNRIWILYSFGCVYVNLSIMSILVIVFRFSLSLSVFLSACSICYWKRYVKVFYYNCEFVFFFS